MGLAEINAGPLFLLYRKSISECFIQKIPRVHRKIKEDHMRDEMLELTRQMVAVPSVNTTSGEKEIGIFIENYLRSIPYFKEHPDDEIKFETSQLPVPPNVTAIHLNIDDAQRDHISSLLNISYLI